MTKSYTFENITLRPYEQHDLNELKTFTLDEEQMEFTSLPLDVLEEAIEDDNRTPSVAVNDQDEVIGFFVVHKHYQHEGYDTPHEVIYVRSLSVNSKHQGMGYGTKIALNIPDYVTVLHPKFDHLYLVVDALNSAAWNLYERAGFIHTATKEDGPIGKERLYYLDLDARYVSNLKLRPHPETKDKIINLMLDGKEIGHIDINIIDHHLYIKNIVIETSTNNQCTLVKSALVQSATFIRRHFEGVKTIELYDHASDCNTSDLAYSAGFVDVDPLDDLPKYIKYINY